MVVSNRSALPQDLYYDPKTAFVAGFVGDTNRWSGRIRSSSGDESIVSLDEGGEIGGAVCSRGTAFNMESRFDLFVRPEAISIERTKGEGNAAHVEEGQNMLAGEVTNLFFDGANSRVEVLDKHSGHKVLVTLPQNRCLLGSLPGARPCASPGMSTNLVPIGVNPVQGLQEERANDLFLEDGFQGQYAFVDAASSDLASVSDPASPCGSSDRLSA